MLTTGATGARFDESFSFSSPEPRVLRLRRAAHILVPRAAILLASAKDRELWQEPILQSAIRGLPVNCAAARFTKRGVERKWLVKGLLIYFTKQLLGAGHLQLKEKQYEVLKVCSY